MTEPTRYKQDPITEALIEIRVAPTPHGTKEKLTAAFQSVAARYPQQLDMMAMRGEFVIGQQVGASAQQIPVGTARISEDKRQMFRALGEGFIFNKLAPYPGWEALRDEAKELWGIYRATVEPQELQQMSVRYINRLDLPAPVDLTDYLRLHPVIAIEMGGEMQGFFLQVQLVQTDLQATCLLNEGVVPPPHESIASLLLDIQLTRTANVPLNENELWDLFELFRARKNQIFEACITDKTRELFNHE